MEQNNEDVEQLNYNEERADEMSEEEIEIIENDSNEGGQQVDGDGGVDPFEKKQRKKKSSIWDEMTELVLDNGTVKVKCNHCKELFTKSTTGATSQYKRHLTSCLQRKMAIGEQSKQKQQVLSFTEGGSDGITSITNFSYDHAKTVKEDCMSTYTIEKRKLKSLLKGTGRISITTDLWKSGQKIQYMVVTGHFIDSDWVLQKRVLNFCNVPPPYTGVIIADTLSKCFIDWGIENKVSSITVDNASYNDVCIRRLREDFSLRKRLMQDGFGQLGGVIDVVREGIKYLNNSESRLLEFAKIKKQLQLPSRKLILDCPTRWNSTYLMLASGLEFKDVFPRYADIDPGFHYVSTDFEWMKVEEVCKFLGIFHEITDMISGSEYPTTNIFLVELYRIKELLNEKALDPFEHIRAMAGSMSTKFDKYWGESNVLLSLGAILDPRYKIFLINHAFPVIYDEDAAPRFMAEIRDILYELYNEYVDCHVVSHSEQQRRKIEISHLVEMAADILSVPVTTVASESTFSAGGRVIDDRRASMSVETVQMLLCGNDWIRSLHGLKNKSRESLDVAESITFEEVELPESFND
ncbi:zinc finger BED domain-containing protein RICESLEEPER 2-like [Coffea arabica]|uniref:Zinc finger BED domain-containing protein RICESLEEPER 2-like n=1 Tax=Coffea arabica TaxID=13443 RepID=A0A6P6TDX8_COFAR